jgi:hypothetical protein
MLDCDNPLPLERTKAKMFCSDPCKFRSRRYPQRVADKRRFRPGKQPVAESVEDAELTDRERRALELVEPRIQTGLKAEDVAKDLGVSAAYQSARAKLDATVTV